MTRAKSLGGKRIRDVCLGHAGGGVLWDAGVKQAWEVAALMLHEVGVYGISTLATVTCRYTLICTERGK